MIKTGEFSTWFHQYLSIETFVSSRSQKAARMSWGNQNLDFALFLFQHFPLQDHPAVCYIFERVLLWSQIIHDIKHIEHFYSVDSIQNNCTWSKKTILMIPFICEYMLLKHCNGSIVSFYTYLHKQTMKVVCHLWERF